MKNKWINILHIKLVFIFFINQCAAQEKYDPDLMRPNKDPNSGVIYGFNYTKLGLLVCYPWEFESKQKFEKLSNTNKNYNQDELVFELQKNGSLLYWFKKDYLINPFDTFILADGNTSVSKKRVRSDSLSIKNIYRGTWKWNFKDSSIAIYFDKNDFNIQPIIGKIMFVSNLTLKILRQPNINATKNRKFGSKEFQKMEYFTH